MLLYTAVMAIKTHGVISSVGLLLNLPITPPLRCAWFRLEVCSRRSSPVNSLGRTDPAEHERMLSHHIVDVNNMILLRQAFSHLSSVSTQMPEILPPSMGSMSPKSGLMGWRVYSISPVSGFFLYDSILRVDLEQIISETLPSKNL